jgi:hypothetical protein
MLRHQKSVDKFQEQFNQSTASIQSPPDDATWVIVLVIALIMVSIGAFYTIKRQCPDVCKKCSKLESVNANRASLMQEHKKSYMQDDDGRDAAVEEEGSAASGSSTEELCDNNEGSTRMRTSSAPAVMSTG